MVNEGGLLPLLDLSVLCSEGTSHLLLTVGGCGMHHCGAGEKPLPFHRCITGENALWAGGEAVLGSRVSSHECSHGAIVSGLTGEQLSSSCQEQKGKTCKEEGRGMAQEPRSCSACPSGQGQDAYSFGRSCRSFLTQRVLGSTQILSRVFSLILENTQGFSPFPSRGEAQGTEPLLSPYKEENHRTK